ncbi:unnamed protein product [Phytophthora lilii]|uniref:Unnamed protein product n=1 Tax=Phytophthora lilii TaxID=2077276 RepID=A0A9W6WME5_9STRA|nr:unnamed protein product [Phytophthora lilii]
MRPAASHDEDSARAVSGCMASGLDSQAKLPPSVDEPRFVMPDSESTSEWRGSRTRAYERIFRCFATAAPLKIGMRPAKVHGFNLQTLGQELCILLTDVMPESLRFGGFAAAL